MAAEQQLRVWLKDRARQRRTQQRIDQFARAWDRGPAHQSFDAAIAALSEQRVEAVAEGVCALFSDNAWIGTLIDGLADQLLADPFFEPPFRQISSDIHNGLLFYEDKRVTIAAGVIDLVRLAAKKSAPREATSVGFSGRVEVLKFLRAGNTRLSFWEAPQITSAFTATDAGKAARIGERRLADGDVIVVDGRHQSFVVEEAHSNLIILQATISLDRAPLSVEYDSASHTFVGCSATGDSASRIQMIATLLRKLGHDGAFDAVAPFLDHEDFFVRWHVMKELLGIDAEAALPHLKRMAARDPHTDVRKAARAVLDRFDTAPSSSKAA